jgi:hypothetical protein
MILRGLRFIELTIVMAGLDPALSSITSKCLSFFSWMAASSAAMMKLQSPLH